MNDINDNSQQRQFWAGEFGNSYIERNKSLEEVNRIYKESTGITVEQIYENFFSMIDKNSRILELGCNIGLNLHILQKLGFEELYGVEINKKAYEIARKNNPKINFINSSIEDYDSSEKFDLVFTAGVLIHIHPSILPVIINKIINLTRNYIFGFEYYADTLTEVKYRGHLNTLWKQNFPKLFTNSSQLIKSVKTEKFFYKNSDLCDIAYLLQKST